MSIPSTGLSMKYKAVIFDLFGTLIPNFSEKEYRQIVMLMATILSVPPEPFWEIWVATFKESILGVFPDYNAKITYICSKLGVNLSQNNILNASQVLLDYEARSMVPRPEAAEVLSVLKLRGYKIGLISDCFSNTIVLWENTGLKSFFEVTIFSCAVGIKKPDPRIYRMALEKLKVKPQHCLYVGDGSSYELTGALRVGMHPVWIRIPDEREDNFRIDEEDWDGPVISSLKEVLDLLQ